MALSAEGKRKLDLLMKFLKTGNYAYLDAPVHVIKVGRNDPCTCGSNKKYKKCCGA